MDGSGCQCRPHGETPTASCVWWSSACAQDQEDPISTPLDDPNCHDSFTADEPEQPDPEVVICTVACNDPECPEPDCPEDLVECTEASCSPPPTGPGACHGNNTICAGSIPADVLDGAFSLQALRPASACHQLYGAQVTDQLQNFYAATSGNFSCPMNYDFFGCEPPNYANEYTCHLQLHPSSNSLRTLAGTEDFTFGSSVHVYPGWNFNIPIEHESQMPFPEQMLTADTSSCSSFSPTQQISSSFSTESTPCTISPYLSPLTGSADDPISPESRSLPIPAATESFLGLTTCMWEASDGVICGLVFQDEGGLQTHVQSVHTACLRKSDGFYCMWKGCARKISGKEGFAQRSKLDRHIQSHTGYKAETCPDCGQQCSTAQSLILHQRTHSGEKPHKCKEPGCNYAAAQASQLTMHTRTRHSKEKPLRCPHPGCTATFAESSNLSKHKKIHLPEAICECNLCPKTFHREDQLKRHMKTHAKRALTNELPIELSVKKASLGLPMGQMQNSAEGRTTFPYLGHPISGQ